MNKLIGIIKPPSDEYDDNVLYGARKEATKLLELIAEGNDSECVTYALGSFIDHKEQWPLKNLIGSDQRIKSMMEGMEIQHALPIQRFTWPQMQRGLFPVLSISPHSTGKTFAHLLYIMSKSICKIPISKTKEIIANVEMSQQVTASLSLGQNDQQCIGASPMDYADEEMIDPSSIHPSYIIICSSHAQVEKINCHLDRMKLQAYGGIRVLNLKRRNLPPRVQTINVKNEDSKLAIKCMEADVLITTPGALVKCLNLDYINFAKCKMLIFDDIDLTLQLHNQNVREIMKLYLIHLEIVESVKDRCHIQLFSTKWTDLLKKFVSAVFTQKTLIFGSISEAALYADLRYDVAITQEPEFEIKRLHRLLYTIHNTEALKNKVAIVCSSKSETEKVYSGLKNLGDNVQLLSDNLHSNTNSLSLKAKPRIGIGSLNMSKPTYVVSDSCLEVQVEFVNDITHIIHYSLPEDVFMFDQRFRLMYTYIRDINKRRIETTVLVGPNFSSSYAKHLYDLISRSSTTLNSTRLRLRDFMSDRSSDICWRWATTGLCRLEKLSKADRFGSYCLSRHSLSQKPGAPQPPDRWPTSGQVRITITHLISPSEFYFWFEAHRDLNSSTCWTKLEFAGNDFMISLQEKLDKYKDVACRSVPLSQFKKGRIYGFYQQQEARVDRVMLLEEIKRDKTNIQNGTSQKPSKLAQYYDKIDYSRQYEVLKVDYGIKLTVYLKNIFELSEDLSSVEPQCHRGFLLGLKPSDNEPDWLYKARKHFYDNVCVSSLHSVTVWVRYHSDGCFWLEDMIVIRKLENIEDRNLSETRPQERLCQDGLAVKTTSEPTCLPPSRRLETIHKWKVCKSFPCAQKAFLREDKMINEIFLLHTYVQNGLELEVRQVCFNQQLIDLESRLMEEYEQKKLQSLNYFADDIYCLVKLIPPSFMGQMHSKPEINRAIITKVLDPPGSSSDLDDPQDSVESKCVVKCLDHGETLEVPKKDIYLAEEHHLSVLPFQAIRCRLADLSPAVQNDIEFRRSIQELLYDLSRTVDGELKKLKCTFNATKELYLYLPVSVIEETYRPLIGVFEKDHNIYITENEDPELRKLLKIREDSECVTISKEVEDYTNGLITSILRSMIRQELREAGVNVCL